MTETLDPDRIADILAPVPAAEERKRERRVREGLWRTVRRAAGRIPFMDEVVAGYFCALDERTPTRVRGTLFAALAYFVLPLDFVPDFILGLGFTDDVSVLLAALGAIRAHIKPAHRTAARDFLDDLARDEDPGAGSR
ncbi:YkvA family protein [Aquibium sp. ELW1220]|uniref:YkvA family protein n=1 Tax=Aquibium sp. ELW1220 TaxID=2976766 RepID=UPI0025B19182|nr:YkvA family protein [Aquibium sp. ELW1220]MDN2579992.1 YkvA family protein [Aquibium sp. ELW1220]